LPFDRLSKNSILCVVGARPNFVKIAPIIAALRKPPVVLPSCLVHTGQHYDVEMNRAFFGDLGIPAPDADLEVGSGSHAVQTSEIMRRFEPIVDATDPVAVLVVGDVNSTIACALVAAKRGIPVVHVEAGLRSFDRGMPEEINRVLTDQISDLLFTTEESARENLIREGIDEGRVHFVGNVMIDTLLGNLERARPSRETLDRLAGTAGLPDPGQYAVLTLHRPSNVDDPETLGALLHTLSRISERLPIVFPVHPRTAAALEKAGLSELLEKASRIITALPLSYLEMLGLMADATLVLTDSGGIQEETTALGVPCLTLRENTERPITVDEGTNTIVGTDPALMLTTVDEILATGGKAGRVPALWDGRSAERIRAELERYLGGN
jgi:UDP-N-acetylglucosamine 2-epimerase (non-hydrolysing)